MQRGLADWIILILSLWPILCGGLLGLGAAILFVRGLAKLGEFLLNTEFTDVGSGHVP